ncbi:MAG: flavodoxin family protein [Candidatus Eremiobacteraeota bacterium]|nr:flavodoxin family protein [Candidatus Eremiobacteraeota bacterium]
MEAVRESGKDFNILAISGSYRKGKTIDTLIDRAVEGAMALNGSVKAEKVLLIEKKIEYCRNCNVCRNDDPCKSRARCAIDDDMQELYPLIEKADAFIFGTPVNMASVTAVMKTFLERIVYIFAYPGEKPVKGCPAPRSTRKRNAIIIVSSGSVPPLLRMWCDQATPLIKDILVGSLNARVMGTLYAGDVYKRGVVCYEKKARRLGEWLVM